jgi:hypothetical protein
MELSTSDSFQISAIKILSKLGIEPGALAGVGLPTLKFSARLPCRHVTDLFEVLLLRPSQGVDLFLAPSPL